MVTRQLRNCTTCLRKLTDPRKEPSITPRTKHNFFCILHLCETLLQTVHTCHVMFTQAVRTLSERYASVCRAKKEYLWIGGGKKRLYDTHFPSTECSFSLKVIKPEVISRRCLDRKDGRTILKYQSVNRARGGKGFSQVKYFISIFILANILPHNGTIKLIT